VSLTLSLSKADRKHTKHKPCIDQA
jgi:hypothetical protein